MDKETRKWGIKNLALILVLAGFLISYGTYAWLNYRSKSAKMELTIGDIRSLQITLKPYQLEASLTPLLTYTSLDSSNKYVSVSVVNNSTVEKRFALFYDIKSIDSGLQNTDDFKYTILRTNDDNVTNGSFNGASTSSNYYILNTTIPANTTYNYKVYVWLYGANENAPAKEFRADLLAEIDALEPDPYTYTVNIYDSNNAAGTQTQIGQAIPANVATNYQFGTPAEAMASWQTVPNIMTTKPYYLKHKVENGIITESYVEFVIDAALKTQLTAGCNGDTACEAKIASLNTGTFTLRGLDTWDTTNDQCKAQYDDGNGNCVSPYYLDNAKEIYRAFGTNCSANPNDANFSSSSFACAVSGLAAEATAYGIVRVFGGGASSCLVDGVGGSYCSVS